MDRRKVLTTVTSAAGAALLPAQAKPPQEPYANAEPRVVGELIAVEVWGVGEPEGFPAFRRQDAWHVGAVEGALYRLTVRNKTSRRLVVVTSVDGKNVITGEDAAPDQTGYVLDPFGVVSIDGWRKSQEQVAQFSFARPADSYAERMGNGANVGVFGFAVFDEEPPREPAYSKGWDIDAKRSGSAPQKFTLRGMATNDAAPAQDLGTAHGDRIESRSRQVAFRRRTTTPIEELSVRYASLAELERAGIALRSRPAPNPFPARQQFAPDPPAHR